MALPRILAVLLATAALAPIAAAAQTVGTATAVNPSSESTPPGATTVTLSVGASIVHKERIHTSPTGTVQLRFVDKSTLSISPNSNILIDEYVYNPNAGTGHMTTTLVKGALRFVGGLLSHEGDATITTPSAAVGIRGGTATIMEGPEGARIINHFGVITVQNGTATTVIRRPGFAVTVPGWDRPIGEPERVTEAEITHYLRLLTSRRGEDGGVHGLKDVPVDDGSVSPGIRPLSGESDALQIQIQAAQHGTIVTEPVRPRRLR